jgi:D-glycero-D-manno-heptose 1,7-bisphosphate phosphatase
MAFNWLKEKLNPKQHIKLVILDRDGVINVDSDSYIRTPHDWQPIPGSIDAIAKLTKHGYHVAIATNQSGIGRGYFDETTLNKIHDKMLALVKAHGGKIDKIAICPHLPEDHCQCRKPNTGLLLEISEHFNCSLEKVPFIGDSIKDLQAAKNANALGVLVLTGKGMDALKEIKGKEIVPVFRNLSIAVDAIIAGHIHS